MAIWNDKRTPKGVYTDTSTGHHVDGSHRPIGAVGGGHLAGANPHAGASSSGWGGAERRDRDYSNYVAQQNSAASLKKKPSAAKRAVKKVTGR